MQARALELCSTDDNITYDKVLELALAIEYANKDSSNLKEDSSEVNKLDLKRRSTKKGKFPKCYRCNHNNHKSEDCYFKDKKCDFCGKIGHIPRACSSKQQTENDEKRSKHQKSRPSRRKQVHNMYESSEDSDCFNVTVNNVSNANTRRFLVSPKINGQKFDFELDTGSAISLMPLHVFETKFRTSQLKSTKTILSTYSGEKIVPLGVFPCTVKLNGQTRKLDLYVVNQGKIPLFGRSWLHELRVDWQEIHAIAAAANIESSDSNCSRRA